ncbi:transposase [Streptomyces sp. CC216C]|uniref:transposase n=1 Tax=Streptomyces sp. CC216C TaxID=3044576 RepID=UPI0024A9D5D1|nr:MULTISPECIES: transposase [unclassified Streptomyces]
MHLRRGQRPHRGLSLQELHDLELRVRAEQQTPEWKTRYAVRSGVEGTVNEFTHGHGMRHCRYRGQGKAHIQHVLTAIAVNIERLSGLPPAEEAPTSRRPTAFQKYHDQREIPRPKSWRTLGPDRHLQDPRQSQPRVAPGRIQPTAPRTPRWTRTPPRG